MAKPVVPGDGYFSIGEYSFPKSKVFQQVRDSDFVVKSVSGDSNLTFKFNDLVDSEGDPYASKEDAIVDIQATMFLPEEEFVVDGTVPQALILGFDDITSPEFYGLVTDVNSVSDWNSFFDLPNLGQEFTSVQTEGNNVKLFGGSGIKIKPDLFYPWNDINSFIISINDEAGCITSVGGGAICATNALTEIILPSCIELFGESDSPNSSFGAIYRNPLLSSIELPAVETIGVYALGENISLTEMNFPSLKYIYEGAINSSLSITSIIMPQLIELGETILDNEVFLSIEGQTISLTIPSALMTVNGGNPDGDIQYLVANNAVTITTV